MAGRIESYYIMVPESPTSSKWTRVKEGPSADRTSGTKRVRRDGPSEQLRKDIAHVLARADRFQVIIRRTP